MKIFLNLFNNINNELHETALEQLGINIIWVENYDEISDIIDRLEIYKFKIEYY